MPDGPPFSPFEVRDDSNPSGDGLSHLNRIKSDGLPHIHHPRPVCDNLFLVTPKSGTPRPSPWGLAPTAGCRAVPPPHHEPSAPPPQAISTTFQFGRK